MTSSGPPPVKPAAPELRTAGPTGPSQAAAAAVLALSRAARSFVLYDARNAVVAQLLGAYQDRMRAALEQAGDLPLELRPGEIALRGEVIYQDADREKSMAWKLFRDGIRGLVIRRSVTSEELLVLLEIVALRYTAVRQQEEDSVTLLRKAGLASIAVMAVEGYVPAEERPEPDPPDAGRAGPGVRAPDGWDTPLPRLPAPAPLAFRAVLPEALAALRAEADGLATPAAALSLCRDLLSEAVRSGWPSPSPDLVQLFAELRDSFLAEGDLGALRQLVELIGQAGAGGVREELLSGLGDARTLDLILQGVPPGAAELPPDLLALVPLLGLGAALDRLAAGPDDRTRALLLGLVLARLPRQAEVVLQRLPGLEAGLVRALCTGLVQRAPERALEVARLLLGQHDDALRLEGLEALGHAGEVPVGPLAALLDDRSAAVRQKAIEVLARRGDEGAVEPLRRALEGGEREPRELEALGRALAEVSPIAAGRLFAGWLHPRGRFLVGPGAQEKRLQWAAVAGLALVPGDEAERQLQALAQGAPEELRRHCLGALARRHKGVSRG